MKIDKLESVIATAFSKLGGGVGMRKQEPGGVVRSPPFILVFLKLAWSTGSIPEFCSEKDTKNLGKILSLNSARIRK